MDIDINYLENQKVLAGVLLFLVGRIALLGIISLASLSGAIFLGESALVDVLGLGGIERWVVYPVLLWVTGFGGYLMGDVDRER